MKHPNSAHLECLAELSARLGANPLLSQAASGNTSIKIGNTLWIKSSGAWLAHALREEIFVGVNVDAIRASVMRDEEPESAPVSGKGRASVETAMHSVLPDAVVIHVHSVNAIAWAVRRDGPVEVARRLAGIDWRWIPYVASGLALARAVMAAVVQAPRTRVFLLANHGLVVTGPDIETADALLKEIEARLTIEPRRAPGPDIQALEHATDCPGWRMESRLRCHALASDGATFEIVTSGILFPCQAIFLAENLPRLAPGGTVSGAFENSRFLLVENAGVLTSEQFSRTEREVLEGLAEVALRVPDSGRVRYLTSREVDALLNADVYRYRGTVESNETRLSVR